MCLDLEYECIVGIKQNKKYKLKKFKVKVKKMPRKQKHIERVKLWQQNLANGLRFK